MTVDDAVRDDLVTSIGDRFRVLLGRRGDTLAAMYQAFTEMAGRAPNSDSDDMAVMFAAFQSNRLKGE